MKANQLVTLVLRLLGIYCLIQVIPAVTVASSVVPVIFAQHNLDHSAIPMMLVAVLFLTFQIAVGVILITQSVPWGEKLAPGNPDEGIITAISFEQVQVLAFAAVGVLIFADALPQLFNSVYSIVYSMSQITGRNQYAGDTRYIWQPILTAIGTILKAALGLWMFFGARGFANFWRSLRTFGTPKAPEDNAK